MRQVVLDTETTGLEVSRGHRVIEIGAVELVDRKLTGRHFHKYLNPEREVDDGAFEVHGLSSEFLSDKSLFSSIADELVQFLEGSQVIMHNASFDQTFIDNEFRLMKTGTLELSSFCDILDSLALARHKHPGQKNDLDALCRRYGVDNSTRSLHGALLDAEILADVYLLMTGGQTALFPTEGEGMQSANQSSNNTDSSYLKKNRILVISPSEDEIVAHESLLDLIDSESDGSVWRQDKS